MCGRVFFMFNTLETVLAPYRETERQQAEIARLCSGAAIADLARSFTVPTETLARLCDPLDLYRQSDTTPEGASDAD